jgi:hypothetical protein
VLSSSNLLLGVSNWPVILLDQLHANKFFGTIITAPSRDEDLYSVTIKESVTELP